MMLRNESGVGKVARLVEVVMWGSGGAGPGRVRASRPEKPTPYHPALGEPLARRAER